MPPAPCAPGAELLVIDGMGRALLISIWPRTIDEIATHGR
jgi:hypothetical protein